MSVKISKKKSYFLTFWTVFETFWNSVQKLPLLQQCNSSSHFPVLCEALKKLLTYSNDYYKVIIMILESCLRLRLLLEELRLFESRYFERFIASAVSVFTLVWYVMKFSSSHLALSSSGMFDHNN